MARKKKQINTLNVLDVPIPDYTAPTFEDGKDPFLQGQNIQTERGINELKERANTSPVYKEGFLGDYLGIKEKDIAQEEYGATTTYVEDFEAAWTSVKDNTFFTSTIRDIKENKPLNIFQQTLSGTFGAFLFKSQDTSPPLTKEEYEADPDVYRPELKFDPSENLTYSMWKDRAERFDDRQRAKIIKSQQSGATKVLMFGVEVIEGAIIDMPLNLTTGIIAGSVTRSIGGNLIKQVAVGMSIGATENIIQGKIIDAATEERLINEGEPERTPEQKKVQLFLDGLGGAILGGAGAYFGYRKNQKISDNIPPNDSNLKTVTSTEPGLPPTPTLTETSDRITDLMEVSGKMEAFLNLDTEALREANVNNLKSYNAINQNQEVINLPTDFKVHGTNQRLLVDYEIRELNELLKNTEEDYPQFLRTKSEFNNEIEDFIPQDFIFSNDIQSGSPLIAQDGTVINGNKRLNALQEILSSNNENSRIYKTVLENTLPQHTPQNFQQPVLVRIAKGDLNVFDLESIRRSSNTLDPIYQSSEYNLINNTYNNERLSKAYATDTIFDKEFIQTTIDIAPYIQRTQQLINDNILNSKFDISQNIADSFFFQDGVRSNNLSMNLMLNKTRLREQINPAPITESILRGFYKDETNLDELLPNSEIKTIFDDFYDRVNNNIDNETNPLKLFEDIKLKHKGRIVEIPKYPEEQINSNSSTVTVDNTEEVNNYIQENLFNDELKETYRNQRDKEKLQTEQANAIIDCLTK